MASPSPVCSSPPRYAHGRTLCVSNADFASAEEEKRRLNGTFSTLRAGTRRHTTGADDGTFRRAATPTAFPPPQYSTLAPGALERWQAADSDPNAKPMTTPPLVLLNPHPHYFDDADPYALFEKCHPWPQPPLGHVPSTSSSFSASASSSSSSASAYSTYTATSSEVHAHAHFQVGDIVPPPPPPPRAAAAAAPWETTLPLRIRRCVRGPAHPALRGTRTTEVTKRGPGWAGYGQAQERQVYAAHYPRAALSHVQLQESGPDLERYSMPPIRGAPPTPSPWTPTRNEPDPAHGSAINPGPGAEAQTRGWNVPNELITPPPATKLSTPSWPPTNEHGRRQSNWPSLQLSVQGLALIDEEGNPTPISASSSSAEGLSTSTKPLGQHGWQDTSGRPPAPSPQQQTVTRQPQSQPGMSITSKSRNRNSKDVPLLPSGKREWSSDLCMFCDHNLGTCCKAFWCPCIVYGKNKTRIEHLYAEEKAHPNGGDTCSDDCAIHACLTTFCFFGWALQVHNRATVRRRYNIDGDFIGDCAAAMCCSSCELSQESREIDLEERSLAEASAEWKRG